MPKLKLVVSPTPAPTCGARAYDCRCGLAEDHLPLQPHACGVQGCLATWTGDPERFTFRPGALPTWPLLPPTVRPILRLVVS